MPALTDLLSPDDRERLNARAHPPSVQDLAETARETARTSGDAGRIAWLCVAVALAGSELPDEARDALNGMLEDGQIKTTALACLEALLNGDHATGKTQ